MKKLLLILLLLPKIFTGQTFYASASYPADGSSNTARTVTITPPAGIEAGDLIVFVVASAYSSTTGSLSIANSGGQTLNATFNNVVVNVIREAAWWSVFNGTWSANPSFNIGNDDGAAKSAALFVFKHKQNSYLWRIGDNGLTGFGTPQTLSSSNGYTYTGAAKDAIETETLALCGGGGVGVTNWGNAGNGWSVAGDGQMKNTAGLSIGLLYKNVSAGSSGVPTVKDMAEVVLAARWQTFIVYNYGWRNGLPLFFYCGQ